MIGDSLGPMGPKLGPQGGNLDPGTQFGPRGQIMGPILSPNFGGPDLGPQVGPIWGRGAIHSFTSRQITCPRAREAHIQVRRLSLYRNVLKSARSATRLGLPRGDIVFFRPNRPNLGGGHFGDFGRGHGVAWLGYGVAWPGYDVAWPGYGVAWLGYDVAWLGMAWPGLGMTWPGWVWRGLAGYGVTWLGTRAGP